MAYPRMFQIARSWIGHLATDPDTRNKLNATMELSVDQRNAALANLINQTVQPELKIAAGDVPQIMKIVAAWYRGSTAHQMPASDDSNFTILVDGSGWPTELKDLEE